MKTSTKTTIRAVLCVVLAAASIAGLAGCPEPAGGGSTIQQLSEPPQGHPQQGQNNLPKQTATTPAK
jgi:hypothetical protein